jgi:hypothetical protein
MCVQLQIMHILRDKAFRTSSKKKLEEVETDENFYRKQIKYVFY